MKKTILLVLAVLLFSIGPVRADALNWNEALRESLSANPELANARHSLELSNIAYRSSFLNYYPNISGSMGTRKSNAGDTSYNYGLSGNLSIFKGFKNTTAVRIKRKTLSIQEAIYKRALSDFVYDLRISFADVLKAGMTSRLLDEIQIRRKNNMELVKLRYDAGREDKGAYLRSEADYLQSKYETQSEKRNYRIVRAEFLKNTGRDIYAVVSATGTFNIPTIKEKPSKSLLQVNPDYVIAKFRMEVSEDELKSIYGDFYPNVGLSGSVSKSGNQWPPARDSWSAGLSLSYPFFSGGQDFYDLKSAKLNRRISENNFKNAELELMLRIESAYNGLINAVEFYEVKEKYHSARKVRTVISKEKYLNGLISYQDWDSIENEFINARKSLLEAQYNVFASWARWLKVIGEEE